MDKSILMQKQVKDNAEDLQKEFLDIKNWEEQMKSKDEELRNQRSEQTSLPPIRSKNKSKTKFTPTKQNGSDIKPKRIKSYDYSAWDKFDIDEACKEVNKTEQSDSSEDEVMSKEELEKAHRVGTKYKNQGNIFVQQQKWAEAIKSYNQAIKAFPYDAIFYANRALCQLKLDNCCSAESDCSAAIQLDATYVKAYHRRATARINLKQYKEAKQDLENVLKLEPSNKEAKVLLAEIEKKMKVLDSIITLKEDAKKLSEDTPIEKLIGEKMWSSTKTDIKDVKESKEVGKDISMKMERDEKDKGSKNLKHVKEENVLKLEPSNKEAKVLLAEIEKKMKVLDSIITLKEDAKKLSEDTPIEKLIGEKMWSSTKTDIKDVKESKEVGKDISMKMERDEKDKGSKNLKHVKEDIVPGIQNIATAYNKRDPRIPTWLPEKDDVVVIEPIEKPPHLRSKKLLTRIPVEEVEFINIQHDQKNDGTTSNEHESVQLKENFGDCPNIPISLPEKDDVVTESIDKSSHLNLKELETGVVVEETVFNKYEHAELKEISADEKSKNESSIKDSKSVENTNNIPPVPKTAVQFVTNWKANKSSEFRYKYLKQLPKNSLSKIFQDSMESDIFNDILKVLWLEFIKRKESIFSYLKDLSEVKRFRALIMFISNNEKQCLRVLFEHCKTIENISQEELTALQEKYEI
ncbi:RNA polymerase II-associated protein 3 isoform X1 [Colletes gigas]|uniref:RNA polymerase II-associated protein 3 isoform X1 n=1 Tax=Colletes gigas TaxID=935657 RepID=UPI001C9B557A|nr:RNA polymerase II-associated protein 3 isoform X1 [Colletes gigas]